MPWLGWFTRHWSGVGAAVDMTRVGEGEVDKNGWRGRTKMQPPLFFLGVQMTDQRSLSLVPIAESALLNGT